MRIPKMFYLVFAVALIVGMLPMVASAQPAANIEPDLLAKFKAEGTANFFVKMAVEADLSAAYGLDWEARGKYVVDALTEVAAKTQVGVIAYAEKHGLTFKSYIINNSVGIFGGTQAAAEALAGLPGVAYIRGEHILSIPDPVGTGVNGFVTQGAAPEATTDWGITDTKADQFWTAFGLKGDGIKVANIDTGVQWNHPALVNQFACPGQPGNAACWADPSNICGGTACDNNGHGTHTMGTMVSKDDPALTYIAGMAPNSTWIACKGCETNSCSDTALIGCANWLLQPGGDPNNRPDVVNNSWGGGGGDNWYQTYVQAWAAAAIFPAFSAGNSGSSCSTLGSPGDYQESFGSAAHDSGRNIASFSSRGPSAFGHEPYTKPNISAPGVSICSTVPTNGWNCGYSGTSMASPHTAGAVALLWSCNPGLIGQIDATFQLLQGYTDAAPAGNCGAPPDGQGNYTFGYGYLNVLAAGMQVCGGVDTGTLEGYVYDQGGNPVEGATVSAQPAGEANGITATTDPNGFYTMQLVVGFYDVTASKANYTPQTVSGVGIFANQTTTQNFTIVFLGAWTQLPPLPGCPDWTRYDGQYYAGTGKVYFMGGRSDTTTDGTIYALDPVAGTCASTGVTMPFPISNYSIVQVNNGMADWLCTFGGRPAAGGVTPQVQCYDPVANAAAVVTNLPGTMANFVPGAEVAVNNKVVVFGGFQNVAAPYETNQTWEWDPVANTWTQKGNYPLGMGYIQADAVDGKIYGFGGTVFDGASLVAQVKTAVYDPALGTWNDAAVAELPAAGAEGRAYGFDAASGLVFAGKVIVAGGGQWPAESAEVWAYDIATDSYNLAIPDLNILRRDHAGVYVPGTPGRMWVFGGRTSAAGYGGDLPPYAPPEFFDVDSTGEPMFLHIDKMKMNQRPAGQPGWYKAIALVRIYDQDNLPAEGANSFGEWTYPDGQVVPQTAVMLTDYLGRTKFRVKEPQCGTYQFCLTDITKAGYQYDPDANQDGPCKTIPVPCK